MQKRNLKLLLILLVVIFIVVNYTFLDKALTNWFSDREGGIVERVIDGDTIVINGTSIRLLGVNSPERGEKYYEEAKNYIEDNLLGKFVRLEKGKEDTDLYKRKLRYVYVDGENVNLELVQNGYANYYFPSGKDKYYDTFSSAWKNCLLKNINLCESSKDICASCIELTKFDVKNQFVEFTNECSVSCEMTNWTIKDEGRKVFTFLEFVLKNKVDVIVGNKTNTQDILYWPGESYVWTSSGDTLFLRDDEGKLVLWKGY